MDKTNLMPFGKSQILHCTQYSRLGLYNWQFAVSCLPSWNETRWLILGPNRFFQKDTNCFPRAENIIINVILISQLIVSKSILSDERASSKSGR